jgi:hypothetical protein
MTIELDFVGKMIVMQVFDRLRQAKGSDLGSEA